MWGRTSKRLGLLIFQSSQVIQRHGSTSKYLQKLLDGSKKKRKRPFKLTGNNITTAKKYVSEGSKHRSFRVSQVVHGTVVDIIDSGDLDPEIPTLGVSISDVVWSPEMSSMNIYWQTKSDDVEKREVVRNLLNSKAKKMRSLLIGRKISGHIPNIQFVWDKSQLKTSYLEYIDKMLSIADYGPDYEPQKYPQATAYHGVPILQASPKILEKLREISEERDPGQMKEYVEKSFRDDIYGLDHTLLMESIQDSKQKLQAGLRKREKKSMKESKERIYSGELQQQEKDRRGELQQQEKDRRDIFTASATGLPQRVNEMQRNLSDDVKDKNVDRYEEPDFLEDEWSDDDDEDFDDEDDELSITRAKSTKCEKEQNRNHHDERINSELLNNDEKDNLQMYTEQSKSPKLNRLGIPKKLGSSAMHSPLRVRDMQRFITDESVDDNGDEIDLLEDEWSDDENQEIIKERDTKR
ncbi:putative ribosome-binding factor A, mitochondrial [Saccostrea echinata]|uniref:putative ribosome-binding factor A, mitochondrial n=1 Tax=Saccostrea echinata TaxID=191078 RepID=UPI002A828392|nr:putative ribosome-binding factor A, mitochondrial [Saccostrea echinata]